MRITISGAEQGPSWVELEKMIRSTFKDGKGKLTRIVRKDDGGDYRAPGSYSLTYKTGSGAYLPMELEVSR